jgi:hypothetical protein
MAKTGHPNVVIEFTSSWRGTPHVWRSTANHSGTAFTNDADRISFLQSYFRVIRFFISASDLLTFVSGVKYYNGTDSATTYEAFFANETAAASAGYALGGGTISVNQGEAFTGSTTTQMMSGLECCTVLQAPVGLSSTGKPVFLKKFIHCAPASQGDIDGVPLDSTAPTLALGLGDGTMYGTRVVCSATGKQGVWVPNPYFGNHQMPRRRKKTTSSSSSLALLTTIAGLASETLGSLASGL